MAHASRGYTVKANFCLEETVSSTGQKSSVLRILVERNCHTHEVEFHNDQARQLRFLEIGDTLILDSLTVAEDSLVTVRRLDNEIQFPPQGSSIPKWISQARGALLPNLIGIHGEAEFVVGVVFAHVGPFFSFATNDMDSTLMYGTNVLIVDRSFQHLPPARWDEAHGMPSFAFSVMSEQRTPLLTMGDVLVGYNMRIQADDGRTNIEQGENSMVMVKRVEDSSWSSLSRTKQSCVDDAGANSLAEWACDVLTQQTCIASQDALASPFDVVVRVESPIENPLYVSDNSGSMTTIRLYSSLDTVDGLLVQLNAGDFLRIRNVYRGDHLSANIRYITRLPRWSFDVERHQMPLRHAVSCSFRLSGVQQMHFNALSQYYRQKRGMRSACTTRLLHKRILGAVLWWQRHAENKILLRSILRGGHAKRRLLRAWRKTVRAGPKVHCPTLLTSASSYACFGHIEWKRRMRTRACDAFRGVRTAEFHMLFRRWLEVLSLWRQLVQACSGLTISYRVYYAWVSFTRRKRASHSVFQKARECICIRQKRHTLRQWHENGVWLKELKIKILSSFFRSYRCIATRVFRGWRCQIYIQRDERQKCASISSRARHNILKKRFFAWQQCAICCVLGHRRMVLAMVPLQKAAMESWKFFHKTCSASKFQRQTHLHLLRTIVLKWRKLQKTEQMGSMRMVQALHPPIVRTLETFTVKLGKLHKCMNTLQRVLDTWAHYVGRQQKFATVRDAVTRCRYEVLQRKSIESWIAFTRWRSHQRVIFHAWRRLFAAARLGSALVKCDATYTLAWWINRFCNNRIVKRILREFNRLYNHSECIRIEVVAGLMWHKRILDRAFTRLADSDSVWSFFDLSTPVGSRFYVATLRALESRLDKWRESQEQSALEALFDYYYQHPRATEAEFPLPNLLCDVIVVILGACEPKQPTEIGEV